MPSVLSQYFSEPVSLSTSNTSPYEPPHLTSAEKPLHPVHNAKKSLMNGHPTESSGVGKRVEGVFLGESDGINASLQSLPNGRSSDSTESRGKTHSRNGSNYSMVNGHVGPAESQKQAPAVNNACSKLSAMDMTFPSSQEKSRGGQLPSQLSRPKSPEKGQPGRGHNHKSHGRAHSSSAPQSPIAQTIHPTYTNNLEASPTASQPNLAPLDTSQISKNRFSSPPILPNASQAPAGSSTTSLHPAAPRLHHRHTLEVPRISTSRTSRDFSYPGTASEGSESGRFSPTPRTPRASNTLARAPTRSVHSDMYLDEVPQDGDMARWTDTIRQKRASRRKRKEEEEDDRVVVGTKVDMNHVNWVTAYNMLTGIRFTVSRTNAKLDRELTDADFDARHKFSFDM